uniref:Complement C3 n=1 Tax=Bos indicus x Bos taurus TaxID=30522 RepID=A0A4W2DNB5_BOBOX
MGKTALPTLWPPRWGWGWSSLSATFPDPGPCRALVEKGRAAPHLSLDLWEVPPLVRLDINSTRTSQGKQTSAEVDKRTSIFHPPPWTCPGAWGCCFSSWGSPLPRLSRCESELRGPGRWHDSLHLTPVHCFPHLNPPIPPYMFTGRYILVTPRVLRIGSPETIHVEAHSDSSEPLSHPLEVNLSVWDFPMKNTRVARRELVLSKENHFMDQASVTIPEDLVYPPKPGMQYVIIEANWAPTSVSSSMNKLVLVAPHAGYIFIQMDKTIYTPEQSVQYRVYTVNHRMDPVSRTFTLDIKNPEGIAVISKDLLPDNGVYIDSFTLPERISIGTWTIEASYQTAPKQKFKTGFEVKEYVLPSFEVQLTPNKTFFYLRDEVLGVNIQARYIFNKPVDGHALAIFGVKQDSRRIPIQSSLQRVEISQGHGHISLQKDTLMAAFQGSEEDFIGASIFVNVTVFSSGGEMVQTEISGVKIVRSPYNIKFIKTPQYFKPGMPFSFRVFVSNPDGSPASKVLVSCTNVKVHTTPRGEATLVINTEANLKELTIQVKTEAPIQPEEQASASMTARPYSTQDESGNFLHIDVKALSTEVGSNLQLNLNTNRDSSVSNKITRFTILLKIGLQNEAYVQPIQPSSLVALKVTGDAEATVGLVAVDKAVHILNSKHKFTQKKIWDTVEEHDIGCTAGSGKDRLAVFKDAGLDMKMSTGMDTLASTDWHCPPSPSPSHRRRRSLKRLETKRKAVNKFKTELEQKCCEAGLRENPVGLSCKERIQHVRHGPVCITAFLSCCQLSETLTREAREEQLLLGTTDEDDDLDDFFLEDEPVRSVFPESWFWKTITLPKTTQGISHYTTHVTMPDSITTWQFVAVSIKTGQGLCVSDPFELTVMKPFFVDLKLPFSVIRNEQVQIQAVLYNFLQQSVKVRVEFPHKESLCSAAKPDAPSRRIVAVPPFSSKVVPFVLLPLEIGKVDVEVKARGSVVQDHVRKTLLVQAGGQIEQISQSFLLNPQGQTKTQLVPKQEFLNKIPNTEADVFVSVQGDILGETILGTLTPSETWRLLRIPSGCPEQTLSSLTPVVILTRYLDSTGQWNKVGVELREQVMKNLARGYSRMLTHRSEDGSYHTSKGNPGSTWLTSYVFRVYALAYPTMTISALSLDSVCNIANWIITHRQRTHGNFVEESPVVMWSMQGGYHGSEADISLTALVLIALNEGKELCSQKIPSLADSMKRAGDFLEKKLPHIRTTFAMAITSYALALIRSPRANDYLDSFASKNKTHWPVGLDDLDLDDSLYTIEATAYALMQKLELGRRNETHAIANWLLKKRQLGGGFQSTQTTVVAIEALTRFREAVPFEGVQDLHIQIKSSKKALHVEWVIDEKNAYQLRSAKFSAEEELQIKASGTGRGTISILTVYHRSPEFLENTCKQYHLNVTLNENQKENKKGEATFQLRMETRFQGHRDATMTIMEISLLTGFYPNQDDLKQLTSEVERYAFQYETKMNSSDSTVVLYLEKLSHKEDTVLGFRVHRMLKAEFLQAAQVTVYDYYEPSRRCTSFYNLPTEHASLRKICDKDVCRCAEEQCPSPKKDSNHLSQEELQTAACEAGVDFVYKASLESVETSDSNPYIYYNMKLQAIIKSGTDSAKPLAVKKFVTHTTCQDSLGLQEHETYLIMGQISDLWRVKSEYIHVLGKETFLMHWPANGTVGKKELLDQLAGFSDYMHTHGCES